MKKIMTIMLSMCLMGTCFLTCFGCAPSGGETGNKDKLSTDKASIEYGFNTLLSSDKVKDKANGFESAASVKSARFLVNGEYAETFTESSSRNDVKLEFYNDSYARLVNASAGMSFTVPTKSPLAIDYSIAKYRTQITLGDSILTATAESSNPYANTNNPWGIYRDEWILRWINNDAYISQNDLERVTPIIYEDKTTRPGFDMYVYSVKINNPGKIERPFYNIGIIRDASQSIEFGMFVMKGKADRTEDMKKILLSYQRTPSKGITKNYYDAGKPQLNKTWNSDTKAYYEALQTQNNIDWGVFSYSMPGTKDSLNAGQPGYDTYLKKSVDMQKGIEEEWGYNYDIFPTYTHLSFGNSQHFFPSEMATALAGGNGKNGKPVLQFTYQFTNDNNNVASNNTPMFDILRGKYDEHLTKLAKDMKAYKMPVLFRLNNEMNTDWTSYSGMMTLCDPDIFNYTWQYLYEIFEKEGVDNAIWIWNPIKDSCPFSSWAEDLCYNPGAQYIDLMGLTSYEMNNLTEDKVKSFKEAYTALYKKNSASFGQYRSIISEFACGSGGALSGKSGRNAAIQAKWVKEMFDEMNSASPADYVKQMIGAVWFNCNDGAGATLSNRLRFFDPETTEYSDLSDTIAAFKKGFENKKK